MVYKNHYVYQIYNIKELKRYVGVRSTNLKPEDDLGFIYFSSSTNKQFMLEQKEHPERFEYEIISKFRTRKEADEEEIYLHNNWDVGVNPEFYNLAKATSTGFSMNQTGLIRSNKTIRRLRDSHKGNSASALTKQKMSQSHFGINHTVKSKEKMSILKKGNKNPQFGKKWFVNKNNKTIICHLNDIILKTDIWQRGQKWAEI